MNKKISVKTNTSVDIEGIFYIKGEVIENIIKDKYIELLIEHENIMELIENKDENS